MRAIYFPVTLGLVIASCGSASTSSGPEQPGPVRTIKANVEPDKTIDLVHETVVNRVEFAAERPRVWKALMAAHIALGLPMIAADEKNGTMTLEYQGRNRKVADVLLSNYIDCGTTSSGPRAATHRLTIRLTHALLSDDLMTRLSTQLDASARHPGMSSDVIVCSTNGRLEKKIVGLVAARLH